MADVRLTATNPEDSSVVPVACDASGRLLLEEQGQGPPGEQGPPGPKGEDGQDGKDGDPFSGNFADDVTFGGSAEFSGNITVEDGITYTDGTPNGANSWNIDVSTFSSGVQKHLIFIPSQDPTDKPGVLFYKRGVGNQHSNTDVHIGGDLQSEIPAPNIKLKHDGSVSFADYKAGFTKEGYLWCTTRRGDTVILDATSNGLASWVEYTPTSRIDDLRDRLDAKRPDTGEMPADTQ